MDGNEWTTNVSQIEFQTQVLSMDWIEAKIILQFTQLGSVFRWIGL